MNKIGLITFKNCVEFARELVKSIRKKYGTRLADVWVHRYACDDAWEAREVFIRELIMCSEQESEAWKALLLIVLYHHRNEIPLPPTLQGWTSLAAAEVRQESKTQGTDAHTTFVRDMAIVVVVLALTKSEGLQATRNGGSSKCGYKGGTACDVVGKALAELDGVRPEKGLKYNTIEGIWTASASPDSPLYRYGPSRRPFIEHPRFLLINPEKRDGRIRSPENLMEFSTPFRILADLLGLSENDEVQS